MGRKSKSWQLDDGQTCLADTIAEPPSGWPDECLIWIGTLDRGGYGRVRKNGKLFRPHRVSYERFVGQIPDGHVVRHRCDNPACWNPLHLEAGTHADNAADRNARNRQARGVRHGNSKLTDEKVKEIKLALRGAGRGCCVALAKDYGVNPTSIRRIKNGARWAHISTPAQGEP